MEEELLEIKPLLEREIENLGAELIDVELKGNNNNKVLKLFVDTEQGINIDKCAQISRKIGDILEFEDFIKGRFRLEVSSPGLNRTLKTAKDFSRKIGKRVIVKYLSDKKNIVNTCIGMISSVSDSELQLIEENKKKNIININKIINAKIKLDW